MEGKRSAVDDAASSDDERHDGVEQYRDFIVDGEIYQALDLSRRLLQLDGGHTQRADAARLMVDRLRSNRDDSSDHANALLRVLANYATPTKELTEEMLSLLFFCEHRVQIIHHLSKLTYQSRECVWLVVDAYIEILSSDRSLLVPILGSLADLPLVTSDKALVVDATESLLDAASEEDVPAVVQSLLSMLVPAAAPRIVLKIRSQCNRLNTTTTLSLTFDVIMRHAVAGSSVLAAFLRAIRHSDAITPFDLIFLALLLARPSENGAAVRVVASLSTKGVMTRLVVRETLQRVRDQKWHEVLPCFVRLASALLTACFNVFRCSNVSMTVECAVDMLGHLVEYRSAAQEEALSLLMSIVSQPQRLVLSASRKRFIATAHALCWDVAHAIAAQLAHIATAHPTSLAPFAHIFLDHLYGIAASAGQSFTQGDAERADSSYPASILETLCRTMILLTKHEPGMLSLLMITIQKQLVAPLGGVIGGITTTAHSQASSVVQVKQLMAIFLAGEMLVQGIGEKSDRASLLSWLQKLLSSATGSDATTAHVVRLLWSSSIVNTLPSADRATSSSLLAAVFGRHGFEVKKHRVIAARFQKPTSPQPSDIEFLAGLSEQSIGWLAGSLTFDVVTYVRVARLGEPPIGWHSLKDHDKSSSTARSVERTIRAKTDLLPVFMNAFFSTTLVPSMDGDARSEKVLVCSFALPSVTEDTFTDQALPVTLWCYASALQLAVFTTNALATTQHAKIADSKQTNMSETVRQRKRLLNRVQVCWTLHKRLRALLDEASTRMKQPSSEEGQRSQQQRSWASWLKLQIGVIEKQMDDNLGWVATTSFSSSLCSLGERLSLQAVSAVFEGLWKQQSSMIESGLEIELFRAFPARLLIQDTESNDTATSFASMEALVDTQDGKRTLKYLSQRLLDYSELLNSLGDTGEHEDSEDQDSDIESTRQWVLEGVRTLCNALRSVVEVCRKQQLQRVPSGRSEGEEYWEETAIELFAKGASDVRIRRIGSQRTNSTGWSTNCGIIFSSLANAAVQSKLGDVAREMIDVLLALSAHTRMAAELSRVSLALLHSPFPSIQRAGSTPKLVDRLPVLDQTSSTALANLLRPIPPRSHHLVSFIVGAWAIPSALRVGLIHVAYIVECVEALVSSTLSKSSKTSSTKSGRQGDTKRKRHKEPDAEEDIDGWIAHDGEHRVLKNLTHDTLPLFLETILACLTTAPLRAIPLAMTELPRADTNPFTNLIGTFVIVSKCLQVFVAAEMSGFNLPQRTSLSVLRCGPIILRNVEQALRACVLWREEGSSEKSSAQVSDLAHLQCLLDAAESVVSAVENVAASFQERVILTMQQNTKKTVSASKDPEDEGKRSKSAGRWGSDLLRNTYRNQFQRRKPLSRSEVKLLPYFTHSAEQLKAHIADTSGTYRFDLDHTRVADALSSSLQAIRMGDQLEGVLALLAPSGGPLDIRALDTGDELVNKWSRVNPADEDEQSVSGNDDASEEVDDDDDGSSQEEVEGGHADMKIARMVLKNGSSNSTKRTNASIHTLVPQKKRVKKTI